MNYISLSQSLQQILSVVVAKLALWLQMAEGALKFVHRSPLFRFSPYECIGSQIRTLQFYHFSDAQIMVSSFFR